MIIPRSFSIKHCSRSRPSLISCAFGILGTPGRAVARSRVLTFAIQVALSGVMPFPFKLVNLAIHLVNGVLIYPSCASPCAGSERMRAGAVSYQSVFPVLLATWWLLSPMAVSTVLYVVQRMTSLAATFSLLGLLFYIRFRR